MGGKKARGKQASPGKTQGPSATAGSPQSLALLQELSSVVNDIPAWKNDLWNHFQRMFSLLKQLIESQRYMCMDLLDTDAATSVPNSERFQELEEWVHRHSAEHHGRTEECKVFEIRDVGEGRGHGLVCTTAIQKGKNILSVPLEVALTTCDKHTSPWIRWAQSSDPLLQANQSLSLVLHLLDEAADYHHSFFKPYLQTLPKSYNLPLYFSLSDIDSLRSSSIFKKVLQVYASTVKHYCYLFGLLSSIVKKAKGGGPKTSTLTESKLEHADRPHWRAENLLEKFSFENFRWAVATAMSRQNELDIEDGAGHRQKAMTLVPLWDLCNHAAGEPTTQVDRTEQQIQLLAMEDYRPGQEIEMCYGARPNSQLFIYAGFVDEGNPYDMLELWLPYTVADPFVKLKRSLLEKRLMRMDTSPEGELLLPCIILADGSVTKDTLTAIQILHLDKSEIASALRGESSVDLLSEARASTAREFLLTGLQKFDLQLSKANYGNSERERDDDTKSKSRPSESWVDQTIEKLKREELRLIRLAINKLQEPAPNSS